MIFALSVLVEVLKKFATHLTVFVIDLWLKLYKMCKILVFLANGSCIVIFLNF